jgi:hypothetical protein
VSIHFHSAFDLLGWERAMKSLLVNQRKTPTQSFISAMW